MGMDWRNKVNYPTREALRGLCRKVLDSVAGWGRCANCDRVNLLLHCGVRKFCCECVVKEFEAAGLDRLICTEMDLAPFAKGVTVWARYKRRWHKGEIVKRNRTTYTVRLAQIGRDDDLYNRWWVRNLSIDRLRLRNVWKNGADHPDYGVFWYKSDAR